MKHQFVPAESKLEAVVRISNLTDSGPEALGPGSKERKSVLSNLAKGLSLSADTSLNKPELGQQIAQALDVEWDPECFSTGYTITLVGLNRLLEGAERWLVLHGKPVAAPKRGFATPQEEATAILSVLSPAIVGTWEGRSCVTEMRGAEDVRWAQDRWPGWYFEYLAQAELIKRLGGGPRKVGNTSFDYHLYSTWDLKAHSDNTANEALLNDQEAMRRVVSEGVGIGFVILSGERVDDDGAFREWHREERARAGKLPRPKRVDVNDSVDATPRRQAVSTVRFIPRLIEVFHIPTEQAFEDAVAQGVLRDFAQGRQQSGAPRKPKFKLMLGPARESLLVGTTDIRPSREPSDSDRIQWQYGPEWLSKLWGIPIAPTLDLRPD